MRTSANGLNREGSARRVLIADDHRMVAEGIQRLLGAVFETATIVHDGDALIDSARAAQPDLIVADINMPGTSGLDALRTLRRLEALRHSETQVPFIMLTMHAEPMIAASVMRAGANGYVLKESAGEDLLNAVEQVLAGYDYVTPSVGARSLGVGMLQISQLTLKQREVLRLIGKGLRSKQIAGELGLSVRTVEAHKYAMMQILDVHSTLELIKCANDQGLLF